jgi:hypothetical protein
MTVILFYCHFSAHVDNGEVSSTTRNWLIGIAAVAGLAILGLFWVNNKLGPGARIKVIDLLSKRFHADVELRSLQVSLFPPKVVGEGLALRHKEWGSTGHPMIAIRKFTAATTVSSLLGTVKSVSLVRLEGLEIHLPPQGRSAMKKGLTGSQSAGGGSGSHFPFVIEKIVADGALLEIEPKTSGKEPLQFAITKLSLHSVGPGQPMAFDAVLANPKPPGLINTKGSFGPWNADSPRETALSGDYIFRNADLSVFNGISGILSSTGHYGGVLDRIEAQGTTDTPDFALATGGHTVDLKTQFSAVIDGTNGDTLLQPVIARFLNTEFDCRGGVTGTPGIKGKTVSLDVKTIRGRIEDILTLTTKADTPVLRGDTNFQTKLNLPPGPGQVMDRLELAGQFAIKSARFSSQDVAEKITRLSLRAQGRAKELDDATGTVASNFGGRFSLKKGNATFSRLTFSVPGAVVTLNGYYGLKTETMDFHGNARMQARLSQMVTGFKSLLLKPVDPFFAKQGAGAVIPIKITGTRKNPSFGLELKR